jgi:hypothetical protein
MSAQAIASRMSPASFSSLASGYAVTNCSKQMVTSKETKSPRNGN